MKSLKRWRQVIIFGSRDASIIAKSQHLNKIIIFCDIIKNFVKYNLWSNQYKDNKFWELSNEEKAIIGEKYKDLNNRRDQWFRDYMQNRKFLLKYQLKKYEIYRKRNKRNEAYRKKFHSGKNLWVESNVDIYRQHFLDGEIKLGDNVTLSKNVTLDYSGGLIIGNNVAIAHGTVIETHAHTNWTMNLKENTAIKKPLIIEDGVKIGNNSIILESCDKIGRYSKIGAGTVVRSSIPPYAIVMGNPAKIVGFQYTPKRMEKFEKDNSILEGTDLSNYIELYNKYMATISSIKHFQQLWMV